MVVDPVAGTDDPRPAAGRLLHRATSFGSGLDADDIRALLA